MVKLPRRMFLLPLVLLLPFTGGCGSAPSSAPRVEVPVGDAVPQAVIARLPGRIARLPVRQSMSMRDFLGALDLEDYRGNVTGGIRFSSIFLELDKDHLLQIRCDPDSIVIKPADVDEVLKQQASVSVDGIPADPVRPIFPLNSSIRVTGCTLRKGWEEVLADRTLGEASKPGSGKNLDHRGGP